MAGKSLGTLTIDLIAKVGGFVAGLGQAERSSEKWRKQTVKDIAAASKAVAGFTGVITSLSLAAGTAGFSLLKTTSKNITETDRWAKSLKVSTQELLSWQFAAEKAGLSGDKIADIFKDVSDKIGDASLNKAGEAVGALDALGLSAEKLSKTSPDKQLLAIGESLSKISSNSQKVNVLESLGNDLSKLLPLFDNNNEKLKQFIQLSKDYGVAPSSDKIDDLIKVNKIFEDIESQIKGLKIEIASALASADLSPLENSLGDIKKTLTDPQVLQGLINLVSGVAELTGWLVKGAAAAGDLVSAFSKPLVASMEIGDSMDESVIKNRLEYLRKAREWSDSLITAPDRYLGLGATSEQIDKETASLTERLKTVESNKKAQKELQEQIKKAAAGLGNNTVTYGLASGATNGTPKTNSSANKLDNSFKSLEQSYQRQIALLDTTGKKNQQVTELEKIRFDFTTGKLTGLNASQKARLEQLATELDSLNALKKANEENLKLAEFIANLQRQNDNDAASLNIDIAGAGLGDKERQRLQERLSIERSFIEQRRDLEKQLQADDISQSLYDKQTAALDDALKQRLAMQEDYYQKLDVLQGDWLAGAQNGFANWADNASDYYSQISSLTESTMTGLVDNISDALSGNKVDWGDWANSVLQSLQKVLLNAMLVDSLKSLGGSGGILGSFGGLFGSAAGGSTPSGLYTSTASTILPNAQGGVYTSHDLSKFSGQIVNSPTMFAFAKGAGLMGEAGPEAIMPLTRTSDGTLGVRMVAGESLGGGGTSGGAIHITQHITVTGNGDAALRQAMQQAARQGAADGAKQARQDMLNDFATRGQGRKLLGV